VGSTVGSVDVHQHVWPAALLEELRRRQAPPMLRGWTLYTDGEPAYDIRPEHHDPIRRAQVEVELGRSLALVSMSTPLGIEALPDPEADRLLSAWHEGVLGLPSPFAAWAAVRDREPDLNGLTAAVKDGCVGLQIGAHLLADPATLEANSALLHHCELLDVPVLVHPGPAASVPCAPAWWAAVHQYVEQLQAAWWSWTAVGRTLLPSLRICFAAGAGLAPLQHERWVARSGLRHRVDPDVYVDTSSYGRQGIDHLTRALGIDAVVLGSDRPYAEPADPLLGGAAQQAITVTNPHRLLKGSDDD
jgi:hypothetical protein